jgi:hypothetical protein
VTAKLSSNPDYRADWLPPHFFDKKRPPHVPSKALYSPSRRKWLIPSTGEIVEDRQ